MCTAQDLTGTPLPENGSWILCISITLFTLFLLLAELQINWMTIMVSDHMRVWVGCMFISFSRLFPMDATRAPINSRCSRVSSHLHCCIHEELGLVHFALCQFHTTWKWLSDAAPYTITATCEKGCLVVIPALLSHIMKEAFHSYCQVSEIPLGQIF